MTFLKDLVDKEIILTVKRRDLESSMEQSNGQLDNERRDLAMEEDMALIER